MIRRFSIALALVLTAACHPQPPEQAENVVRMPDPGADGEYEVDFPDPTDGEARHLRMSLSDDLRALCGFDAHFAFDVDEPRPQDDANIELLATCLNAPELMEHPVRVVGHADRRGTDEYNVALAKRRADNIRKLLVDHGVDPDRIVAASQGEYAAKAGTPVSDEDRFTHGYDRRVHIELMANKSGEMPRLKPVMVVQ